MTMIEPETKQGYRPGHRILSLFLSVLLGFFASASVSVSASGLPVSELAIGDHRLQLEVAATPRARTEGLMFRRSMPADHGMLFIWERDDHQAMWMRNTYLPLSVAFVDSAFRIVNISDMEPLTTRLHHSHGPVRYAIEVHQGWFERHGIRAGMQLADLPRVIAAMR
jgi:uncharacterized membrane protein (UPF0127 family)